MTPPHGSASSLFPSSPARSCAALALAAFMGACGIASPDDEEAAFVIEGAVVADPAGSDPTSGHPVAGARVVMENLPDKLGGGETLGTATSAADGSFELRVDRCGSFEVEASGYFFLVAEGWDAFGCGPGAPRRYAGIVLRLELVDQPGSTLAFESRPSDDLEACHQVLPGWACVVFTDGYRWIVDTEEFTTFRNGGTYQGGYVQAAVGRSAELHHVLDTDLVARLSLDGS